MCMCLSVPKKRNCTIVSMEGGKCERTGGVKTIKKKQKAEPKKRKKKTREKQTRNRFVIAGIESPGMAHFIIWPIIINIVSAECSSSSVIGEVLCVYINFFLFFTLFMFIEYVLRYFPRMLSPIAG